MLLGYINAAIFFIDGSDVAEEGTWRHSNGDVMTYLPWLEGEPSGGSDENCIIVEVRNPYSFQDYHCDTGSQDHVYGACEYEGKIKFILT